MTHLLFALINPRLIRPEEWIAGAIRVGSGLLVALLVYRLARRVQWPRPFRIRFIGLHIAAAPLAALAWFLLSGAIEALVPGWISDIGFISRGQEFLVIGTILYAVVVGFAYAIEGSARAARAEASVAHAQIAALRAQLHPHFLFNALHTVVQLIPTDPERATEAAELIADLLRVTLDEKRDEIALGDEWNFVSRYLAIERIRFGDRLVIRDYLPARLLGARVPAFSLQTLVENAVQHGAARSVKNTEIVIGAAASTSDLTISVRNSNGRTPGSSVGTGTGLSRLRERLAVLHGSAARLSCRATEDDGYEAMLTVPLRGLAKS